MLTLTVDFNVLASGLVRGLREDVTGDDELLEGALVLLDDGEGNEALGTLREVRDGLVFAEVDWNTWGPAGTIRRVSLPLPEQGKRSAMKVTGDVQLVGASSNVSASFGFAERPVCVPA
jgi:hypothetical protein